ncbi:MAG: DUF1573 domain-containing protein [Phycisphaerales bacterium]|nr:DUF1573 domain-containing protein [Phycisphaerales bacterium]
MKSHQLAMFVMSGLTLIAGIAPITHAQALEREDLAPSSPAVMDPALEGKGSLVFASKTQDTGEILDTELFTMSYLFRNTGAGPLTITQVKPSCGCTVPELAKKTYMPGEAGTLEIAFDPKGKRGAVSRTITIFTDSELTPNETIVVRALVKPVILIEPMVIPFDALTKGETSTKEFKIFGRTDDFKVTRVTVDNSKTFDIEIVNDGEVEKNGEKMILNTVRVTIRKDAKPDNHRGMFSIRTNDERKPIFTLSAVARVLGDLKMNPIRVTMGRMAVGDEFEREFHVTSKSNTAFEIKNAYANSVALDAVYTYEPVDPERRNDWIVRVTGKVIAPAPRFNTQLHILTDVQDEEQLTVQMYGQLRDQ